jgi:hypothetical protein
MRRHCGYHLESAAEPKPAVARLSHVNALSRIFARACHRYPVGVGRSAKTPTCESLCRPFRSNLTGDGLWRCGWPFFVVC